MKNAFLKTIGTLMILVLFGGCTTVMNVNATDVNGDPVYDARVLVDGEPVGTTPSAAKKVSNFVASTPEIRVTKEGYRPVIKEADKEIKVGPLVGGFFAFPVWLWIWGPRPYQYVILTHVQQPANITPAGDE